MNDLPDFSRQGYQVVCQLSQDANSERTIYLANDSSTQHPVIINQFEFAEDEAEAVWAIASKIKLLEGLIHRGLPLYIGKFKTSNSFCVIQEYIGAKTLAKSRSFDPEQIEQIAIATLEILIYLQSQDPPIIHGDIQPQNVLVDPELNVFLINLGFDHISNADEALSMFRAPEQIDRKGLTKASDLYGLGAILISLLTDTNINELDKLRQKDGKINFRQLLPTTSPHLLDWLEKMVEPDLKARYPNAEIALEGLLGDWLEKIEVALENLPPPPANHPKVVFSESSLEFVATKIGQKLTKTITITNPQSEFLLAGKWSVEPDLRDRAHAPDSHAFISFSPQEFESNQIECQITVDTSKLIAGDVGDRAIALHANSSPKIHSIPILITTAPLPFGSKEFSNIAIGTQLVLFLVYGYFWGISLLIVGVGMFAGLLTYILSVRVTVEMAIALAISITWTTFFSFLILAAIVIGMFAAVSIKIPLGTAFVSFLAVGFVVFVGAVIIAVAIGSASNQYADLPEAKRYDRLTNFCTLAIAGFFSNCLGTLLARGISGNIGLLFITLGSGMLLGYILTIPGQNRKKITAFRQREKRLRLISLS